MDEELICVRIYVERQVGKLNLSRPLLLLVGTILGWVSMMVNQEEEAEEAEEGKAKGATTRDKTYMRGCIHQKKRSKSALKHAIFISYHIMIPLT